MATQQVPMVMAEVTDPEELAKARVQRARFDRNSAWLQAHAKEVYTRYRGQCVVIAGAELFAVETPEEAWALAATAHPRKIGVGVRIALSPAVHSSGGCHPARTPCWRAQPERSGLACPPRDAGEQRQYYRTGPRSLLCWV